MRINEKTKMCRHNCKGNHIFLIFIITIMISLPSCVKNINNNNMDGLAIDAYCHWMMLDYDYINNLPRAGNKEWHWSLFPNKEPIPTEELEAHVSIIEISEFLIPSDQKMYTLSLDETGQEMIKEWAGESMTESWASFLSSEMKITLGIRHGRPYLVSF